MAWPPTGMLRSGTGSGMNGGVVVVVIPDAYWAPRTGEGRACGTASHSCLSLPIMSLSPWASAAQQRLAAKRVDARNMDWVETRWPATPRPPSWCQIPWPAGARTTGRGQPMAMCVCSGRGYEERLRDAVRGRDSVSTPSGWTHPAGQCSRGPPGSHLTSLPVLARPGPWLATCPPQHPAGPTSTVR